MLLEMAQVLYFFAPAYAADVVPVLVRARLETLAQPIDGGRTFRGKPILGSHKTWRGLVCGTIAGILVYQAQVMLYELDWLRELGLLDYSRHPFLPGLLLGLGALLGDSAKSFFKRQIGISPGSSWLPLDQLDFFVGAYLLVSIVHAPALLPTLAVLPIVFVCDVAVCALAYWLGLKEAWI